MTWTPYKVTELQRHHSNGLLVRESADILGVSRASVAGKRRRLGLGRPHNPNRLMRPTRDRSITMRAVTQRIAAEHGLTLEDLTGPSRKFHIAHARQAAMLACWEIGRSSLEIGQFFKRDHSTVLHGIKRARERRGALA